MRSLDIFIHIGNALADNGADHKFMSSFAEKLGEEMYPVNTSRRMWAEQNIKLFYRRRIQENMIFKIN